MLDGLEMRFIRARLSGATPEYIVLISETPMWDDYPQKYSQFLSDLSDVFPQSQLYYFGRSNNQVSEGFGLTICSMEVDSFDPKDLRNKSAIWYVFSHRLSESGLSRAVFKSRLCQHEDSEFLVYDYEKVKQFNSTLPKKAVEEEAVSPDSVIAAEDDSSITMAPRKLAKFSILCEQKNESSPLSQFNKGYSIAG